MVSLPHAAHTQTLPGSAATTVAATASTTPVAVRTAAVTALGAARRAAVWAALGVVGEAALGLIRLVVRGERERLPALHAGQLTILIAHSACLLGRFAAEPNPV